MQLWLNYVFMVLFFLSFRCGYIQCAVLWNFDVAPSETSLTVSPIFKSICKLYCVCITAQDVAIPQLLYMCTRFLLDGTFSLPFVSTFVVQYDKISLTIVYIVIGEIQDRCLCHSSVCLRLLPAHTN